MENHHHQGEEEEEEEEKEEALLSSPFQAFRSGILDSLTNLLSEAKPGSEILPFSWIKQCFRLIPMMNESLTKLITDVDHPMSRWDAASIEVYLSYTLSLLDHLNLISSCISHMARARLWLSHALSLLENSPSTVLERLKPIESMGSPPTIDCKGESNGSCGEEEAMFGSGKEGNIHQALTEMKNIGFWVCGVVLCGLSGDAKGCLEIKKLDSRLAACPFLKDLENIIFDVIKQRGVKLKEVKDVNDAVARLEAVLSEGEQSEGAAEKLRRKLEEFEGEMEGFRREVDELFCKVLAARNELLDAIRLS